MTPISGLSDWVTGSTVDCSGGCRAGEQRSRELRGEVRLGENRAPMVLEVPETGQDHW